MTDTIYQQIRPKKDKPICDRMGNELQVGDLIAYSLTHFQVSGSALYVGHITKISPKSRDVYATNIPLAKREKSEEKKIRSYAEIIKLNDDFAKQLMVKRLTDE